MEIFKVVFIVIGVFTEFGVNGMLWDTGIALIRYQKDIICAGIVITNMWVLTAGVCTSTYRDNPRFRLSIDIGTALKKARYLVKDIKYPENNYEDIVLLKLETPVEDKDVKEVELIDDDLEPNEKVSTMDTKTIPFGKGPMGIFLDPNDCYPGNKNAAKTKLCVKFTEKIDECPMIGSPVHVDGDIFGVRLNKDCKKTQIDVYGAIHPFIPWIIETIALH